MVMLHIKLKGITNAETLKQFFLPADPPPPALVPVRGVKIQLFKNMVMLHIKLKGMEHRAPCKHIHKMYYLTAHTLNMWVGLKGEKLTVVTLHIKLRGKKYRLT